MSWWLRFSRLITITRWLPIWLWAFSLIKNFTSHLRVLCCLLSLECLLLSQHNHNLHLLYSFHVKAAPRDEHVPLTQIYLENPCEGLADVSPGGLVGFLSSHLPSAFKHAHVTSLLKCRFKFSTEGDHICLDETNEWARTRCVWAQCKCAWSTHSLKSVCLKQSAKIRGQPLPNRTVSLGWSSCLCYLKRHLEEPRFVVSLQYCFLSLVVPVLRQGLLM